MVKSLPMKVQIIKRATRVGTPREEIARILCVKPDEVLAIQLEHCARYVRRPRPHARNSSAWKDLEREIVKAFEELKAKRVYRGGDFSQKDVDVKLRLNKATKKLQIDGKYRKKHAHHTFMNEIIRKYCYKPGRVPVLVTKHWNQRGAFATVPLDFLAKLLVRFYKGEA